MSFNWLLPVVDRVMNAAQSEWRIPLFDLRNRIAHGDFRNDDVAPIFLCRVPGTLLLRTALNPENRNRLEQHARFRDSLEMACGVMLSDKQQTAMLACVDHCFFQDICDDYLNSPLADDLRATIDDGKRSASPLLLTDGSSDSCPSFFLSQLLDSSENGLHDSPSLGEVLADDVVSGELPGVSFAKQPLAKKNPLSTSQNGTSQMLPQVGVPSAIEEATVTANNVSSYTFYAKLNAKGDATIEASVNHKQDTIFMKAQVVSLAHKNTVPRQDKVLCKAVLAVAHLTVTEHLVPPTGHGILLRDASGVDMAQVVGTATLYPLVHKFVRKNKVCYEWVRLVQTEPQNNKWRVVTNGTYYKWVDDGNIFFAPMVCPPGCVEKQTHRDKGTTVQGLSALPVVLAAEVSSAGTPLTFPLFVNNDGALFDEDGRPIGRHMVVTSRSESDQWTTYNLYLFRHTPKMVLVHASEKSIMV